MKKQLIRIFKKLSEGPYIHEGFKRKQYKRAVDALENYSGEINDYPTAEKIILDAIPGSVKIVRKVKKIFEDGYITLNNVKINASVTELDRLAAIFKVGAKTGRKLFNQGYTIEKLKENNSILDSAQKKAIKYFNNMFDENLENIRMPRSDIVEFESKIKPIMAALNVDYTIAGSYRRKLPTSGDIDVLITSNDNKLKKKLLFI